MKIYKSMPENWVVESKDKIARGDTWYQAIWEYLLLVFLANE